MVSCETETSCTFSEAISHYILSNYQQHVSDFTIPKRHSHYFLSFDQQEVSDITHFVLENAVSSKHFSLWPKESEWCCPFFWRIVSLHLVLWISEGEHYCPFLWKGSLFTSCPMTNRKWVTLHISWRYSHGILTYDKTVCQLCCTLFWAVLWFFITNLFLWPTGSEWHYIFSERQSDLITSCPMSIRMWVILPVFSERLFHYRPTSGCKWCPFIWKTVHHILSYDHQDVSDICLKASLTTSESYPMIIRRLVTHIVHGWMAVSLTHLVLWPTVGEWHCTVFWRVVSTHLFMPQTGCEALCSWPTIVSELVSTDCERLCLVYYVYFWSCIDCEIQFHANQILKLFPDTSGSIGEQ